MWAPAGAERIQLRFVRGRTFPGETGGFRAGERQERPVLWILVSASIDELLELTVGDLGLIDPEVREFRSAGHEDHPREFAADGP